MAETPTYPTRDEVVTWVQQVLDSQPDVARLADMPTSAQVQAMTDYVAGIERETQDQIAALSDALADSDGTAGTVTLSHVQYEELRTIAATNVTGIVVVCGLLALVLGVLVGMVVTRRWGA